MTTTPIPQTPSPRPAMRYFEVFGDALAEVLFLRNLVIILGGLAVVLTISVVRLSNKPPLVVRVDQLREPVAAAGLGQDVAASGPEVRNFVEHFTRYLFAWDLYTLDDDIDRAFTMMTPEAAGRMKRYLDGLNVSQKVKADALRTKVVIAEIAVEKDAPHAVRVKLRGSRIAASYDKKDLRRETIFEDTLVLRKVQRTVATPWGLLVEAWSENVFKETE